MGCCQPQGVYTVEVQLFKNKYLLGEPIIGRIRFSSDVELTDVNCYIQLRCHNSALYNHNRALTYEVDNVIFTGDEIHVCTLKNLSTSWVIDFSLDHNINRPSINIVNGKLERMQIEYNIVVSFKKGNQILRQETVPVEMIEVNPAPEVKQYLHSHVIELPNSLLSQIKPKLFYDLAFNKLEYLAGETCNVKLNLLIYPRKSAKLAELRFLLCQECIIKSGRRQANPRIILAKVMANVADNQKLEFIENLRIPQELQTQTNGFCISTQYYIAIQVQFQNSQSKNNLEIIVPIKVWSRNTQKLNAIPNDQPDDNETKVYTIPQEILAKIEACMPDSKTKLCCIRDTSLVLQFKAQQQNDNIGLEEDTGRR